MGAWSTIKIDNKYTIGEVKYGVPYFIKFIPKNKIQTDYNHFVATIDKTSYIKAMLQLLKISKHPFANYFLYRGVKVLQKIPGRNVIINYKDVNLNWDKNLHVYDIVTGDPNITTNELFKLNSYNMWFDLMTLTGLISYNSDLVGAKKYLNDAYSSNINNFVYIKEKKLVGEKILYKIPLLKNQYISSNWFNYLNSRNDLTDEFKVFITTFIKYHHIEFNMFDKFKISTNLGSLKPYDFKNYRFSYYDIGIINSDR